MRTAFRFGSWLCLTFVAIAALAAVTPLGLNAQSGKSEGSDLERAHQRIEGSYELEEWKTDGKVLRPPQIEGRWSARDGVVLFMVMRKDLPVAETVVGYGTYHFEPGLFSYGYSYLETLQADAKGILTRRVSPPNTLPLKLAWKGDVLVATGKGPDIREYRVEGYVSPLGENGDYRKWRKVR